MSTRVKNIGVMQYGGGATVWSHANTKEPAATFGEVGTVRAIYNNIEYVFGPNQTISFADDGIAAAVAAQDSRLGIVDDRDGAQMFYGNASGAVRAY